MVIINTMVKPKPKSSKKITKKAPKKVAKPVKTMKKQSNLKKTLNISSTAAIIYAAIILPVLMVGGFAVRSVGLKIVDSILLLIVGILLIMIIKSYILLSKRKKFTNIMAWILLVFTIIITIFNILKLFVLGPPIILYIVSWLTGLIYILFGISLFKLKKLNPILTILAVFYIISGVFNASLVFVILIPAMVVVIAVGEAVLFKHLAK
jgi:hypothetical protein